MGSGSDVSMLSNLIGNATRFGNGKAQVSADGRSERWRSRCTTMDLRPMVALPARKTTLRRREGQL
jgi:hypothetical protein